MKPHFFVFIACFACLLMPSFLFAQNGGDQVFSREINIRIITGDSVVLALNEDFDMIEDECSQVLRFIHFDNNNKKFFGRFVDVSAQDNKLILTEGTYSHEGSKEGLFITHYLNGNLQAKGNYKNNVPDGFWELFYNDGTPRLTFEANGKKIRIINAWNRNGDKVVENGNGDYEVNGAQLTEPDLIWKGKLVNGTPDGAWTFSVNTNGQIVIVNTEIFKEGVFKKGSATLKGNYRDASRIMLIPGNALPFLRAEMMSISAYPCDDKTAALIASRHKKDDDKNIYVDAHYKAADVQFNSQLFRAIFNFTNSYIRQTPSTKTVVVYAEISNDGRFTNGRVDPSSDLDFGMGIKSAIYSLPPMQPATINSKPVKQKFMVTYYFDKSRDRYAIEYKFLPVSGQ